MLAEDRVDQLELEAEVLVIAGPGLGAVLPTERERDRLLLGVLLVVAAH